MLLLSKESFESLSTKLFLNWIRIIRPLTTYTESGSQPVVLLIMQPSLYAMICWAFSFWVSGHEAESIVKGGWGWHPF